MARRHRALPSKLQAEQEKRYAPDPGGQSLASAIR